jgi:hypothetical protein
MKAMLLLELLRYPDFLPRMSGAQRVLTDSGGVCEGRSPGSRCFRRIPSTAETLAQPIRRRDLKRELTRYTLSSGTNAR